MTTVRKKLIEVALPLDAINVASAREKSIRHGHPSTLHLWWARRPLAAARAVIFAQMVDDPSANPDLFLTEKAQEKERQRLFRIIEELVKWESTTNERVLQAARDEIWQSWRRACTENVDHPRAKELFNRYQLPAFHDPFAGGGTLPVEAQRLGLETYASDLNPVAVLINKAMVEIPPKLAGRPPVNPETRKNKTLLQKTWHGVQGLAEDLRYYAQWMCDEASKRVGHLYPNVEITAEMARERGDLKSLVGQKFTVIASIWARTVKSPNPAFAEVYVPLASTFMLSTKTGKEAYVEPVVEDKSYHFRVKLGRPADPGTKSGTKLERANFSCVMSGAPISGDYVKIEAQSGRMAARLMSIVVDGPKGRLYLSPTSQMETVASTAKPSWKPDEEISGTTQYLGVKPYGMTRFSDLFTNRQLVVLSTFSDLVMEVRSRIVADITEAPTSSGVASDSASDYADAVAVYLGLGVSRLANRSSTLNFWDSQGENVQQVFARQALSMTWDYVEGNAFSSSTGNFLGQLEYLINAVLTLPSRGAGHAFQADATKQSLSDAKVISTDPPYFDNVPYADLSDFFYVWLRKSLRQVLPELFGTVVVPKKDELVAFAYRHSDKDAASAFFMKGMKEAMQRLVEQAHPAFPVTIYYAFRQAETEKDGVASTGWETFLDAVIQAGFEMSGTWPMRTEYTGNLKTNRSALASSIVLVCWKRGEKASSVTRREFLNALKAELPTALSHLQRSNIAPVHLAQAAIGPGMAVYTRYSRVVDASGKSLSVREALSHINQALDEVLAEQEGDFDSDTRWAVSWFEQSGFAEGEFGVAETLSKAKNTSVDGMVEAGILASSRSKVRLLKPNELSPDWDPARDERLNVWETVHQLIRALEAGGEGAAATLVAKIGSKAETARELAYRLYTICERKKRAQEAISYNGLVQSWPEIVRLANEGGSGQRPQAALFGDKEE